MLAVGLRALVLQTNLAVHGLPVVVTRPAPDDTPINTSGIWLSPLAEPDPFGQQRTRVQPRKVLVLPRADVNDAPRGTLISAPETAGGTAVTWQVDGLSDPVDPDSLRLLVTRKN